MERVAGAAKAFEKKLALQREELGEREEAAGQEEERAPDPRKDAGYFDAEGVFRRARGTR